MVAARTGITGSELVYAYQGGELMLLTRAQVTTLLAAMAIPSFRPFTRTTKQTGDEQISVIQGGQSVLFSRADFIAYLAASGRPDPITPYKVVTSITGNERIVGVQGGQPAAFSIAEMAAIAGGALLSPTTDVLRDELLQAQTYAGVPGAGTISQGGGGGGPAATFTMTQLTPWKGYQRITFAGSDFGKGDGGITVTLPTVTAVGTLYARLSSGGATRGDVKAPWLAKTLTATGAQTVGLTIPARQGFFQVDLSGDGVTWTNGTSLVLMGDGILGDGQSLEVRMIGAVPAAVAGSTTSADLGVAINPYVTVYAKYTDVQRTNATPAWGPPVQTGAYDSAGLARLLDGIQQQVGVGVFLAGMPQGDTRIDQHTINNTGNEPFASKAAILNEIGGFRFAVMFDGHSNARDWGTTPIGSQRAFRSYLTSYFRYVASKNSLGNNFRPIVLTIPNISSSSWGTTTNQNNVRKAGYDWTLREGREFTGGTPLYVNNYGVALTGDGTHQTQVGSITIANAIVSALAGSDQTAGDGALAGPPRIDLTMTSPTYTSAGKFRATALDGGRGGATDADIKPIIGPVTVACWVKKPSAPGSRQVLWGAGGGLYVAIESDGKLNIGGDNTKPTSVALSDNLWHFLAVEEDSFPFDGSASTTKIRLDGAIILTIPGQVTTQNNSYGVRDYGSGGGFAFNPSVMSEFSVWNKLIGNYVPTAALTGNEVGLVNYFPLATDGNNAFSF